MSDRYKHPLFLVSAKLEFHSFGETSRAVIQRSLQLIILYREPERFGSAQKKEVSASFACFESSVH